MINYETGSWLLTAGALPDVDSVILLNWGTPIVTFIRSNLSVDKAAFEFDLGHASIFSGVTITWLLEGVTKTATSNAQGKFTGDATGSINYALGTGKIIPNKLPQKSTTFNVIYNFGTSLTQTKNDVIPDSSQKLVFTIGTGSAIQPNSVELEIPVSTETGNFETNVLLTDVPVTSALGNLVNSRGAVQGSINYSTGLCEVTPQTVYKQFITKFEAAVTYGTA